MIPRHRLVGATMVRFAFAIGSFARGQDLRSIDTQKMRLVRRLYEATDGPLLASAADSGLSSIYETQIHLDMMAEAEKEGSRSTGRSEAERQAAILRASESAQQACQSFRQLLPSRIDLAAAHEAANCQALYDAYDEAELQEYVQFITGPTGRKFLHELLGVETTLEYFLDQSLDHTNGSALDSVQSRFRGAEREEIFAFLSGPADRDVVAVEERTHALYYALASPVLEDLLLEAGEPEDIQAFLFGDGKLETVMREAPSTGPGGPTARAGAPRASSPTRVRLTTDKGAILVDLDSAPPNGQADSFLRLAREGSLDGMIFHSVEPGALLVSGVYSRDLELAGHFTPTGSRSVGLSNPRRGTLSMNTESTTFYVHLADRPADLEKNFSVFGTVVAGMPVADRIGLVRAWVPTVILKAEVIEPAGTGTTRAAPPPARPARDRAAPTNEQLPGFGEYVYVEELPEVITKVQPVYPEGARAAGVAGTVMIQVLVGKDGRVKDTRVVKSIPTLDQAAIAAVEQWVFRPALSGNRPVAVWVAGPVRFGDGRPAPAAMKR